MHARHLSYTHPSLAPRTHTFSPAPGCRNPQQADIFLSASGDCTVKVWDLRQAAPTLSLAAHAHEILSADWCKYNDCIMATASVDKTIKVGSSFVNTSVFYLHDRLYS
jgi:WD40 repeat protein